VPTHRDIDELVARIDELNRNVSRMAAAKGSAAKKSPARKTTRPTARKSA
jgi:outer membrane murein-binding lipoprotein Lpp